MNDDRPSWARRMSNERRARGWSQAEAVRAMRSQSPTELPSQQSMLRQWKRWESGEVFPGVYQGAIAATFGTATHAMFPVAPQRDPDSDVLAVTGMDTLELVGRLQVWGASIRAAEGYYPSSPQEAILAAGVQDWMTDHALAPFAGAPR